MKMTAREEAAANAVALSRTTMNRTAIRVDEALYPRNKETRQLASEYAEAKRAGAKFPPIRVDQHGRLIDGMHRLLADDLNGVTQIEVERVKVKDDAEFFRLAATANAHHGQRYTGIDYAHIVLRGRELGIPDDEIARLVYVTPGFLEEAIRDWFALNNKSEQIAIKRTIKHMRGRKLSAGQLEANSKLSGMNQGFYVNQLRLLLENDLIDTDNSKLLENLQGLQESLGNFFLGLAKKDRSRNGSKGV